MSDDEDIQYVKRRRVVHFGAMDKEGVPERQEVSSDNMQVPTYIEDLFFDVIKQVTCASKQNKLVRYEIRNERLSI